MKRDQFWPDRRRGPRFQNDDSQSHHRNRP
jgi:hypothetical protein